MKKEYLRPEVNCHIIALNAPLMIDVFTPSGIIDDGENDELD